jgi:HAD superfamily hydrolase (TIGR01509 family)
MTFLFDIGRVLLDFDFEKSLVRLLPDRIPNPTERLSRLLERKDELEAGRIDVDTYTTWALDILGGEASPEEFHHAWQQIFTPNAPMWDCVRKLSADGHRLILFSNINGIHCPWIFKEFPQFELFHSGIYSFQTGSIKPQPEIYKYAIKNHNLDPADTLYIDDLPQNVAAGIEFGFRAWQYNLNDHAAFERWLDTQLNSSI